MIRSERLWHTWFTYKKDGGLRDEVAVRDDTNRVLSGHFGPILEFRLRTLVLAHNETVKLLRETRRQLAFKAPEETGDPAVFELEAERLREALRHANNRHECDKVTVAQFAALRKRAESAERRLRDILDYLEEEGVDGSVEG